MGYILKIYIGLSAAEKAVLDIALAIPNGCGTSVISVKMQESHSSTNNGGDTHPRQADACLMAGRGTSFLKYLR
jgi:hypothetical protein